MATQSLYTEEGQPTVDTTVQQAGTQEVAALTPVQSVSRRSSKQEALLRKTGLSSYDFSNGDIPPPTYGEIYGEIRNEKDGLGTSARVAEDGRVNIRINQVNRRLSQIFNPALRQQIQSAQTNRTPPAPVIPPSLIGEGGGPVPPLNIVIQVVGSRGDVQPFIAMGKVLKGTYGHRVRLATHPNFKDFVQENGLEFFNIGGDPSKLMAFMVKNPSLMPGMRSLLSGDVSQRRKDVAEYIQGCWRSCYEAGDGMASRATEETHFEPSENEISSDSTAKSFVADCIIANPPSFAHIHCAEKMGIPLHVMFTMPYSPTQAFPHPLANIQSSNADPQLTNYLSYIMIETLSWQGLGDIINRFRVKCLALEPISLVSGPGMLHRLKVPHTYCWSPALIPKPRDWGSNIDVSGFSFLDLATHYTPPADLQEYLNAGPPPVYIGFGSIVLDDPDTMTELIFEAVRKTKQRVLLSKGWGGLGIEQLDIPDGVYMLDNIPHDWLFKQVSCVVHHGGAGTTAAGIAAGRPTVIVPFFGDQSFWGAMVARAGAGPSPIPHKQLTADKLAEAIEFCLKPESLERARELASKIVAERGSETCAQSFHQHLNIDRLRCTLAPSRSATWRIKRTQVKLSAFAACTLANANLLDFQDLKLFRPQEYNIDEGPWDPISGGAAASFRAFSGMAMGLIEIPSETVKAFQIPMRSNRQQSQNSISITSSKNKTSQSGEDSILHASLRQNQTGPDIKEPLTHLRNPSTLSITSLPASNIGSSSASDPSQDRANSEKKHACQLSVHSWKQPDLGKNRDMLCQTGAHTNKGFGRLLTSFVQSPVDVTVGLTRGFHNFPKMWGDDTVRRQEQVRGYKSGAVAAGREFGYGMYDGITGLVTQPWKGAQQGGFSGFAKGFGKGIGGFATKPAAGISGLLGHTMKGMQKEIRKLFGSNVQSHIAASRVAQGYEEWLQSSEAEKQAVIVHWKLIQRTLKKREDPEEIRQGMLGQQHKTNTGNAAVHQDDQDAVSTYQPASPTISMRGSESDLDATGIPQPSAESLPTVQQSHLYDSGHLTGTRQVEFEAQQRQHLVEKTPQEKRDEEIVMEYIKKQSFLEAYHQHNGDGQTTAVEHADEDDEDLQQAIKLSMQGHEHNSVSR